MKRVRDTIFPRIRKKLECIRKNTKHCIVNPTIGDKFQVGMFKEQFTMDLMARVGSCR